MKLYLGVIVFSLSVQQYYCQAAFSCSNPMIKLNEGNELYRTDIEGSINGEGYYLRDKENNRTMFVNVVIDTHSLKDDHKRCDVDVKSLAGYQHGLPDAVGQIVPYELGGSCDTINLFSQNYSCNKGLWTMFERWVHKEVLSYDRILFCVRLSYEDNGNNKRPTLIVSRTYSYPQNEQLRSFAINNPLIDECQMEPNALKG